MEGAGVGVLAIQALQIVASAKWMLLRGIRAAEIGGRRQRSVEIIVRVVKVKHDASQGVKTIITDHRQHSSETCRCDKMMR